MRNVVLTLIAILTFTSCINTNEAKNDCEKLRIQNQKLKKRIKKLNDSITNLRFTAPERQVVINELVSSDQLDSAKFQIIQLKKIFPNSKESENIEKTSRLIEIKEEQARIKQQTEDERLAKIALKASQKINSSSNLSSSSRTSYSSTCGARTKKGGSCKRKVSGGGYCHQHR